MFALLFACERATDIVQIIMTIITVLIMIVIIPMILLIILITPFINQSDNIKVITIMINSS